MLVIGVDPLQTKQPGERGFSYERRHAERRASLISPKAKAFILFDMSLLALVFFLLGYAAANGGW